MTGRSALEGYNDPPAAAFQIASAVDKDREQRLISARKKVRTWLPRFSLLECRRLTTDLRTAQELPAQAGREDLPRIRAGKTLVPPQQLASTVIAKEPWPQPFPTTLSAAFPTTLATAFAQPKQILPGRRPRRLEGRRVDGRSGRAPAPSQCPPFACRTRRSQRKTLFQHGSALRATFGRSFPSKRSSGRKRQWWPCPQGEQASAPEQCCNASRKHRNYGRTSRESVSKLPLERASPPEA